jgi:antitoxin component HigA of HigAB toxin-antitoxin module
VTRVRSDTGVGLPPDVVLRILREIAAPLAVMHDRENVFESADSNPIKRLRRLMEGRDMSVSDLGRVLGNRALGPAILRGDRAISKANAACLGKFFKMKPSAFIQF